MNISIKSVPTGTLECGDGAPRNLEHDEAHDHPGFWGENAPARVSG
jgi:hypothetical protein